LPQQRKEQACLEEPKAGGLKKIAGKTVLKRLLLPEKNRKKGKKRDIFKKFQQRD